MGIMLRSSMVQWKDWQIGIGIRKDVKIITKVPAVTGGIPTDRAIWLRKVSIAVTGKVAGFPAVTGMVRAESGGSDNRSTVASDVQMRWIDLSLANGFIQEASTKDTEKESIGFFISMKGGDGKARNQLSNSFFLNRVSFLTLSLGLFYLLINRWLDMGGQIWF